VLKRVRVRENERKIKIPLHIIISFKKFKPPFLRIKAQVHINAEKAVLKSDLIPPPFNLYRKGYIIKKL